MTPNNKVDIIRRWINNNFGKATWLRYKKLATDNGKKKLINVLSICKSDEFITAPFSWQKDDRWFWDKVQAKYEVRQTKEVA